jgi:MarR family 2-MHQ and catechol resistance regulon transcriptional repressor
MPTHYRGQAADRARLDAFIKMQRAHLALSASLNAWLAGRGLTAGQFGVLETLWHLGPLCQHQLGAKLLSSRPNITAVLGNLERDGLVRRRRETQDRRSLRVHLTPKGRRLIGRVFPDFVRHLRGVFAPLDAGELEQFGVLNKKLGRFLAAGRLQD